jgi:uncharacterized protein YjbJ (UPF0337 family)
MKHSTFENHWDEIKGQLKSRFGQLTDDDLIFAEGKGEELFARLREKLNMSSNELDALLEELQAGATNRVGQMKAKAAGLADEVRAKVGAAVGDVKAKGAAAVGQVKEQAGVAYEEARKQARSLREEGEEYVRQNPRESLIGALCAGFVAGLLIRR